MPSSIISLNLSNSSTSGAVGRYNTALQVLAFGRACSQKHSFGCGLKPRGGMWLAPVAKTSMSLSVTCVAPSTNLIVDSMNV